MFSENRSEKVTSLTLLIVRLRVGAFGNVKVGWLKSNPGKKYAIKTMKKHEII